MVLRRRGADVTTGGAGGSITGGAGSGAGAGVAAFFAADARILAGAVDSAASAAVDAGRLRDDRTGCGGELTSIDCATTGDGGSVTGF